MHEAICHHEQYHPHVTERLLGYRRSLSTHFEEMAAFSGPRDDLPEAQASLVPVSQVAPVVRASEMLCDKYLFLWRSL